jgi:hypothetical protein
MDESAPISTSPMMRAPGAMNADPATVGMMPANG